MHMITRRSSWQIMMASIYALVFRNFEQRFIMDSSRKRALDLLRIFIEPIGHILLWVAIRAVRYHAMVDGGLNPTLFILIGVVGWLLSFNFLSDCLGIIKDSRSLFYFRQIKPLDPVIALWCTECITICLVFCTGLATLSFMNIDWQIAYLGRFIAAIFVYQLFLLGLGFLFAVMGFFSKMLLRFFRVVIRFFYLFSGIFYSIQTLSPSYRQYFEYNPLFQCIQIARESFLSQMNYSNQFGDLLYLTESSLFVFCVGLSTYVLCRHKMMVEITERQ